MVDRRKVGGSPIPEEELPALVLPVEQRDHCLGPVGARYTLVEYGDYECPHCAEVQPTVREIRGDLGDDLCFAFRNFPIPEAHPHAVAAARAAEAAAMQAKFWLMHDRLFEHRTDLSEAVLRQLARGLPLDMATYDRDLASPAPARRVDADVESGTAAGVVETPTLFVNGRMYVGARDLDALLNALRTRARP